MKKLITIILLSIALVACDDDPVSIDDKKIISDLGDYNIIYTYTKETDDTFEMGVNTYNVKTKEITEIVSGYSYVNSPVIDNKILISKAEVDDKSIANHYLYDLKTGDSTKPFGNRLADYNIKYLEKANRLLLDGSVFQDIGPIYTSNLDGSDIITIESSSVLRAKLSNINNMLFFIKFGGTGYDNYLINSDGTNKQLISSEKISGFIDWHPTAKRILALKYSADMKMYSLFEYDVDKQSIGETMNIDTMSLNIVQYSPDGKKLLIADRFWNVYLYKIQEKKLTKIIQSTTDDSSFSSECFSWTPDSRFATFLNPNNRGQYDIARGEIMIIDTETMTVEKTQIPNEAVKAYWYKK